MVALLGCTPESTEGVPVAPPAAEARWVEDVFEERARRYSVDELFLIDSAWTEPPSPLLVSLLGYLLDSGIDYHVGVAATDGDGTLREVAGVQYLDPDTPNAREVLSEMVALEGTGDGVSRGLDVLSAVLEGSVGFRRPDSHLNVILVTEADDASAVMVSEVVEWLDGETTGAGARISGFVPDDAVRYRAAIEATGGVAVADDEGLGSVVGILGLDLSRPPADLFLSRRPVVQTLDVRVEAPDATEPGAFSTVLFEPATYDANGALTNEEPARTYRYDASRNAVALLAYRLEPLERAIVTYQEAD